MITMYHIMIKMYQNFQKESRLVDHLCVAIFKFSTL